MIRFRLLILTLFSFSLKIALAGEIDDAWIAYQNKDYKGAISKFRTLAEQGDVKAQFMTASMYHTGLGVIQDYKVAAYWYQLAAAKGDLAAQFILGGLFDEGKGVTQDYKEAVRWYRRAALKGDREAQNNLGRMYGEGRGVLQDYARAHMWFNIAAVGGNKDSVKNRDVAASKMTAQQIEQAQRMARECMASNYTKCD